MSQIFVNTLHNILTLVPFLVTSSYLHFIEFKKVNSGERDVEIDRYAGILPTSQYTTVFSVFH